MHSHYINGTWKKGNGPVLVSIDPSSSESIWQGNEATEEEIEEAVSSAEKAFTRWSDLGLDGRLKYLYDFKKILAKNQKELALAISQETGKPLWESLSEVASMINKVDISKDANNARCREASHAQTLGTLTVRHRPYGVMAVFGPYNFPGHVPYGQIIPALLAGNTIVHKPSELTPLVGEKIFRLWEETKIPPGVINLVQGGKETGEKLLCHPRPHGFLFTGSWKTGQHFAKTLSNNPDKILALEMGGNNPLVIGEISDFRAAAYMTIQSAFITSGQRCTCARRLIVPEGERGDTFITALIEMTKTLKVGKYGDQPEPFMGPVISKEAAKGILDKKQDLLNKGAVELLALKQLDLGPAFLSPGIIDVTQIREKSDEEIFGPLLQVVRVSNFVSAIEEANRTQYGLTAGLLSDNSAEYHAFHRKIQAGVINWNTPLTGLSGIAPFGGVKHSGNHRPVGFYAIDFCAYPVSSLEAQDLKIPAAILPGVTP